jgi:hypothetical protein
MALYGQYFRQLKWRWIHFGVGEKACDQQE